MTYGRLLRYFLGITTVVFAGLWVFSLGVCRSLDAASPSGRISFALVHGNLLLDIAEFPAGGGRYGLSSEFRPHTLGNSQWGSWKMSEVKFYRVPGTTSVKAYDENFSENDYQKHGHAYYRKSEIPAAATIVAVYRSFVFPLWLPYLAIVACAVLLHTWLTCRAASRQREILASAGKTG